MRTRSTCKIKDHLPVPYRNFYIYSMPIVQIFRCSQYLPFEILQYRMELNGSPVFQQTHVFIYFFQSILLYQRIQLPLAFTQRGKGCGDIGLVLKKRASSIFCIQNEIFNFFLLRNIVSYQNRGWYDGPFFLEVSGVHWHRTGSHTPYFSMVSAVHYIPNLLRLRCKYSG